MRKRLITALILITLVLSLCSCSGKAIEFNTFDGVFSPFFARSVQDMSVVGLTHPTLLVTTGDESPSAVYDAYERGLGIADIDIEYVDGKSVCKIRLGEDIYFSDGVKLTSKDVAFSYYVYSDLDCDGWADINTLPIAGLLDYQYNNEKADEIEISDDEIASELENPSETTAKRIKEGIIYPVLEAEYKWVCSLYSDPAFEGTEVENHIAEFTEPEQLFAYYYSVDTEYKGTVGDGDATVKTVAEKYGTDYKLLGDVYGSDLSDMAKNIAKRTIMERKVSELPDAPVDSISGIERVDDYNITLTLNSQDREDIEKALGIYVAPCHYYGGEDADKNWGEGKPCAFDIDCAVISEKNSAPMGAGRYVLDKYEEGKYVKFKKNTNYFRDEKLQNSLTFKVTGDSTDIGNNGYLVTPDNRLYVESDTEEN